MNANEELNLAWYHEIYREMKDQTVRWHSTNYLRKYLNITKLLYTVCQKKKKLCT